MTTASGIYLILNTKSKKLYLGQAQNLRKRWNEHKRKLNAGIHTNSHLQAAWNKYGADAFEFKVLEYCDIDRLSEREQHFLDTYIPKGNCYNIAQDASAPMRGIRHSTSTRKKMSALHIGINNAFFGKSHSAESRQRMSAAAKYRPSISDDTRQKLSQTSTGRTHSEETRQKLSEIAQGRVFSEETRRKMSESKSKMSEETRQKISEANLRRPPFSDETRRKISEGLKGKPRPEETRLKISEGLKRAHARRQSATNQDEG